MTPLTSRTPERLSREWGGQKYSKKQHQFGKIVSDVYVQITSGSNSAFKAVYDASQKSTISEQANHLARWNRDSSSSDSDSGDTSDDDFEMSQSR